MDTQLTDTGIFRLAETLEATNEAAIQRVVATRDGNDYLPTIWAHELVVLEAELQS